MDIGISYFNIKLFNFSFKFSNFPLNNCFVYCLNNKHFSKKSFSLNLIIISDLNLSIKYCKSLLNRHLFLSIKIFSLPLISIFSSL